MAFPQRLLSEGEEVVDELRPHWVALGWALPAFVGSLAATLAVTLAWPSAPAVVQYVLALLPIAGALWLAGRWLRWRRTTLVITTGRLIQRTGVLARRGTDIRLERVNEISYQQSIWQRMVGTGRLFVDVGGDRGVIAFEHVRHPAAVASVVHEEIVATSRRSAGGRGSPASRGTASSESAPTATRAPIPTGGVPLHDTPPTGTVLSPIAGDRSVAQRLIDLDELRRRGILSESEFAERRARLLDQL